MKRSILLLTALIVISHLHANEPIDLLQLAIPDTAVSSQSTVSPAHQVDTVFIEKTRPAYDWTTQRHSISYSVGAPGLLSISSGALVSGLTWLFSQFDSSSDHIHYYTVGTHALHYRWNARKWLRVGGDLSYCNANFKQYDNYGYGEESFIHEIATIGKVDFTYLNLRCFKLYSGLGIGVGVTWGKSWEYEHMQQTDYTVGKAVPTLQFAVTPIGMEFGGNHVYGLLETNIGTTALLRLGIGYHF